MSDVDDNNVLDWVQLPPSAQLARSHAAFQQRHGQKTNEVAGISPVSKIVFIRSAIPGVIPGSWLGNGPAKDAESTANYLITPPHPSSPDRFIVHRRPGIAISADSDKGSPARTPYDL